MQEPITPTQAALGWLKVLHTMFVVVRERFETAHHESKLLPEWRERQFLNFLSILETYTHDLEKTYEAKRVDSLATALRNLLEIAIWIKYCGESDTNAQRFFFDCVRDARELLQALRQACASETQNASLEFDRLVDDLRNVVLDEGISGFEDKFIDVRDAAKELKLISLFGPLYKLCSKLAHPTSLVLNVKEAAELLDPFLLVGKNLCVASLSELLAQIQKTYPTVNYTQI